MTMPMIEYDRGKAVGLVSYVPRDSKLPTGVPSAAAHRAFSSLHNDAGDLLPFLTVVYDPRNWAMKLFPHNKAASALMEDLPDRIGWSLASEQKFAELLFAMRGRPLPDMFGYGVDWREDKWLELEPLGERPSQPFPCADLSERRRAYEPTVSAPMRVKLPCLDVDLAVVDPDHLLSLVVDYKRVGAVCDTAGTNATALASLAYPSGALVPAFMTRYTSGETGPRVFETYPLNKTASMLLSYALSCWDAPARILARAEAGDQWVSLTEEQWLDVLKAAQDV